MPHRQRILVADSSQYFDSSIWNMLIPDTDFNIIGQAENTDQALKMTATLLPDIILADMSHSRMRGLATVKSLKAAHPRASIVAFSPDASPEYTRAALEAGAVACLPKPDIANELLRTLYALRPVKMPVNGINHRF